MPEEYYIRAFRPLDSLRQEYLQFPYKEYHPVSSGIFHDFPFIIRNITEGETP